MEEETALQKSSGLARAVAAIAVIMALLAVLAGLGSRWGWWLFRTGFGLLRWSVYGAIVLLPVSLITTFLARPRGRYRGLPFALFALAVSLAMLGNVLLWRARGRDVPPIHDITTDTQDPPLFIAIAPLRADAPNGVDYGGPEVAAQQRAAYPDIRPLVLNVDVSRAFERALRAARSLGWEIVADDAAAGRIEATDRTLWFGFRDDIVIRLTASGDRTVVDVRSVSRVGRSDVGTNARRIRAFLQEVQAS